MSALKHDIEHTATWVVDRRAVLGTLAAASAVSLLPLSAATAASLIPSHSAPLLADWHIDDQWGPRYAEPIAFASSIADDAIADAWSAL
jgi:hypothetical protein